MDVTIHQTNLIFFKQILRQITDTVRRNGNPALLNADDLIDSAILFCILLLFLCGILNQFRRQIF